MADLIVPRDYQNFAVEQLFNYFGSNSGNPLVVMPTGTGKSIVIGQFIKEALTRYPGTRCMALTHVKELIAQNAEKLLNIWPNAPLGINSAALKERSYQNSIIFGGIGSVCHDAEAFGHRDFIFIDEAHLVGTNEDAQYLRFIASMKVINPKLKIIGPTATHFRMKLGSLTNGGIFTDIPVDMSTPEWIAWFIASEHMVPLISPGRLQAQIDTSNVGLNNGEFKPGELQNAADRREVTQAAIREALYYAGDRRRWLVFCSGVEHAEHVAEDLCLAGVPARAVHSKNPGMRDKNIELFKSGKIRALTNNNILTTGFDDPEIDCILMLRPTQSVGLWVQMLGRGTRPAMWVQKRNCLVLDFSGNTVRLGPFDRPKIPNESGGGAGDLPVKICEACGMFNHIAARVCSVCGEPFFIDHKLSQRSSTQSIMSNMQPQVEWFDVRTIYYNIHNSNIHANEGDGKPDTLCVRYACGAKQFKEFIGFESNHAGGLKRAKEWWMQRSADFVPKSCEDALYAARAGKLRQPRRVRVWVNKKWPEILSYEF